MKVRLDKRGYEFACDLDGVRNTMRTIRPDGMEPQVWKEILEDRKKMARKAERDKAKTAKAQASEPAPVDDGADPAPAAGALAYHVA